jgi:hypothetical protein
VRNIDNGNFGLLIAYIVPGFVALIGVARIFPAIQQWLAVAPQVSPTIGGFLYSTLGAVGAGIFVNAFRWQVVDRLHHLTGVPKRTWDYSRLPSQLGAFQFLVSNQFRYYECYANLLVSIGFTFVVYAVNDKLAIGVWVAFWCVEVVLWNASRRTLVNYHARIGAFLGPSPDLASSYVDRTKHVRYTSPGPRRLRRRILARISLLGGRQPARAIIATIHRRVSVK